MRFELLQLSHTLPSPCVTGQFSCVSRGRYLSVTSGVLPGSATLGWFLNVCEHQYPHLQDENVTSFIKVAVRMEWTSGGDQ